MTALTVNTFGGEAPSIAPHMLPETGATTAKDCDLRYGDLRPMKSSLAIASTFQAGAQGVWTKDGLNYITSASPMKAYLSPTVDDVHNRVYITNENTFAVARWTDAYPDGRAVPYWKVGVPTPTSGIVIEKRRKNRWPGFPSTTMKGRFFLEDGGRQYSGTEITLTAKPGTPAFSTYTFDATVSMVEVETGPDGVTEAVAYSVSGVYFASATTLTWSDGTTTAVPGGWYEVLFGLSATLSAGVVTIKSGGFFDNAKSATVINTVATKIRLMDGSERALQASTPTETATTPPSSAVPCVELWLENNLDGARLWTAFSSNSYLATAASGVPGGVNVTLTPTGATTYEVSLVYGTVEDRAYAFTMINDWNEESAPSTPNLVAVSFLDDVVLRVDYDECVSQLEGYRPLDRVQFYCATTSVDYLAIKTAPADAQTLTDLYRSLLWREPDAAGLAYWEQQYDNGMSLSDIATAMKQSIEYKNVDHYLIVEDVYVELLERPADDPGLHYWVQELVNGMGLVDVIWSFMQSSEYKAKFPTPPSVTTLYQMFLGRDPEAAGLAYWNAKIAENPRERAIMLYAILNSKEYKDLNISRHITTILTVVYGRAPTSGELTAAINLFNAGHSFNALAYTIASAQSGSSLASYIDEGGDRLLGWTLDTTGWDAPKPDLTCLTQLPNGVFAAKRGNTLWFSEPYRPHAWPSDYAQSIPDEIVGLAAFEGQVLVTTTGSPLVVSGAHPSGMTKQFVASNQAGLSEWSMAVLDGVPFYATRDGLVEFNGVVASLELSRGFWTSEKWRELYGTRLSGMRLMAHDGRLIALFASGDGFMVSRRGGQPTLVMFSELAGQPFYAPGRGDVFLSRSSGAPVQLFAGSAKTYRWKSKLFVLPSFTGFAAAKVMMEAGSATVTIYGDGATISTEALSAAAIGPQFFRLPSGTRYQRVQIEVSGTAVVHSVHLGMSYAELKNV